MKRRGKRTDRRTVKEEENIKEWLEELGKGRKKITE